MARVLVVSSQVEARDAIVEDIAAFGHDAVSVADLGRALDAIEDSRPDVVILDLLDRTLGPETAWRTQLQQAPRDLPFILLIPEEGLRSFEFPPQAVDFILVPFGEVELETRLARAVGSKGGTTGGKVIKCGGLEIDLDRYQVYVQGEQVDLTLKEFELLRFLVERPGKVHTRESLMAQVWGYDYFGGTRTVDVHIRRIRAKLEPLSDEYIETVRGVGYRFRD